MIYFSILETPELFTTYDYKQLIDHVKQHAIAESEIQLRPLNYVEAYYSPAENKGVVLVFPQYLYPYQFQKTEFSYGTDHLTITFQHV